MANLKETIEKVEAIKDTVQAFTLEEIYDQSKDLKEALDLVIKDLNKIRDDLLHPAMQNIIT